MHKPIGMHAPYHCVMLAVGLVTMVFGEDPTNAKEPNRELQAKNQALRTANKALLVDKGKVQADETVDAKFLATVRAELCKEGSQVAAVDLKRLLAPQGPEGQVNIQLGDAEDNSLRVEDGMDQALTHKKKRNKKRKKNKHKPCVKKPKKNKHKKNIVRRAPPTAPTALATATPTAACKAETSEWCSRKDARSILCNDLEWGGWMQINCQKACCSAGCCFTTTVPTNKAKTNEVNAWQDYQIESGPWSVECTNRETKKTINPKWCKNKNNYPDRQEKWDKFKADPLVQQFFTSIPTRCKDGTLS